MLTLTDATVAFAGVPAVDGVDLRVPDGCVLALLGPSGCGKSTLLRAVAGLEPLRRGRIDWDGVDLARIPVHRRGFGLMFQDGVLFPHRNVAQNVGYGLRATGWRGSAAAHRVSELLELVGLPGFGGRSVTELSGGEAQRVALARALAPSPRLLLLDEPLAALDRSLRDSLLSDLRTILSETGTPAIFVTHDQQEAFAVADRVALMRAGRLVQTGSPAAVWTAPADEWAARFVGYTSVVNGTLELATNGTRCIRTGLGLIATTEAWGSLGPGSSVQVALRPAALVLDPDGGVTARCVAVVSGPDRTVLTVSAVASVAAVSSVAAGSSVPAVSTVPTVAAADIDRPDSADDPGMVLAAVAGGAAAGVTAGGGDDHGHVAVGDVVRLRFDPAATAVIGTDRGQGAEDRGQGADRTSSAEPGILGR